MADDTYEIQKLLYLYCDRLDRGDRACRDDDLRALRRRAAAGRLAHARPRTGDDDDLVLEDHVLAPAAERPAWRPKKVQSARLMPDE